MRLIVSEKPSVAYAIGAALGVGQKRKGYLEGNGYLISWCFGHLAALADADQYDPKYKKWRKVCQSCHPHFASASARTSAANLSF